VLYCGRRRRNVYDKKPRRYAKDNRTAHLTARSDKSVAYLTNNKRLYSTFCTVEANYILTDTKNRAASLRQQSYLYDLGIDFCRAMLCKRGLCRHAVSVRLSVHPCVTFVNSVETNIFLPSGSHIVLVFFHTKGHGNIPTGPPP